MSFSLLVLVVIKVPPNGDHYFSSYSFTQLSLQQSQSHFTVKVYHTNAQEKGKKQPKK